MGLVQEKLAQFSRFTLSYGKQAFYRQIDLDESAAYDYAQEAIAMNCLATDAQEGIRAFLEKRKAEWKDCYKIKRKCFRLLKHFP